MGYGLWRTVCAGVLALWLAGCGGGGGGDTPPPQANQAPRAVALASGDVRADAASGGLAVTVGGLVRLDGASSTDADADTLSHEWTLTARPAASAATLSAGTGAVVSFRPDVVGSYTVSLKVTDGKGASHTQQLNILADNRAPVAALAMTPQFTAVPSEAPLQTLSVGTEVLIDGSASTDPDGDPVTVSYTLEQRPAGSSAALQTQGQRTRLSADTLGRFRVRAVGSDGRGASFETVYTFDAVNRAPNPVIVASLQPVVADLGVQTLSATVGYDLLLDGRTSTDPDGDAVTHAWQLEQRPSGSSAALSATQGGTSGFAPDVLGEYHVALTVTDATGASSVRRLRVMVNNQRPLAQIGSNATPQALPAAPRIRLPLGTELTLRGSLSTDADGDPLTHAWSVDSRPSGSTALPAPAQSADPRFVPDAEGVYVLRLRVTDSAGAFSERTVSVEVGGHAPVAVIDRGRISLLVGETARASAALSFDDDGDTLTYSWTLDAKPSGSSATISGSSTQQMTLQPDVAGTYVAAVTVSDGSRSAVAYVTVVAMSTLANSVALNFVPDEAHYSRGLDRLVLVATNPDTLRIVDPFTGGMRNVPLPTAVRRFSLSPDGLLAAVLHDNAVTLVDLQTAAIIRTSAAAGQRTDVFVTNAGVVFLIGQVGGQWVDQPVLTIDARTGVVIPQGGSTGFGFFYGTQYGLMADRVNKVFLVAQGLSPSDISFFEFNPSTSQVTRAGDSPYHGDYAMYAPLFLSETQSLVFSAGGAYFRTDNLTHAGTLSNSGTMTSLSHSAALEEALVISATTSFPSSTVYPSSYRRYSSALLLPDTSLNFPTIGGAQSYGIRIFHSSGGRHVALVQTGTDQQRGAGAAYHVILR